MAAGASDLVTCLGGELRGARDAAARGHYDVLADQTAALVYGLL
jgi:hypothetical protein